MPRRAVAWPFLLWALGALPAGGCAGAAPEGEPPGLRLVVPADYPYGAPTEAAPVESATLPRVLGWSDATHVRSVDRLVPTTAGAAPASEVLRFEGDAIRLEGDPAVSAAVAAFLADRRRFDDVVIELEAELSRVDLDALPPAGERAAVQVPTASAALALAVEAPPGSDAPGVGTYRALLVLDDGETATIVDRAPLAAIQHPPHSDTERILGLGPFAGYSIKVQPALAEEGRVLAGWLEAEVGSLELSRGERVEVWGARGPRVEHELVTLRFALRPGETLWVLMDRPGARRDRAALALRLRWLEAEAQGREERRVEEAEPVGD